MNAQNVPSTVQATDTTSQGRHAFITEVSQAGLCWNKSKTMREKPRYFLIIASEKNVFVMDFYKWT